MKDSQKHQRAIRAVVTSDSLDKTRTAKATNVVQHPLVGKYIKRSTKYMFHDEKNTSRIGDEVMLEPCRPLSARKSFILKEIISKAKD
tara:strand:+ start:118 stop:381 length:264 start_codon:yes stop_codon:yes gene_type:complete